MNIKHLRSLFLALLIALINTYLSGQEIKYDWAKKIGESEGDISMNTDYSMLIESEHIYITGWFTGSIKFTDITLTGEHDIFIAKLDTNGNTIWVKSAGGNGTDKSFSVTVDNNDNIYITGYFTGIAHFDQDTLISTSGASDIFIAKLNSNGNYEWAKQAGDLYLDEAHAITCNNDYIFITGTICGPTS